MRVVGVASDAKGLGVHDHLSWPYEDRADFLSRVREFLADGLAMGLRCVYADDNRREAIEADLVGIPDLGTHLADGTLQLSVLEELYDVDQPIDPTATLAGFAAASREAVSAGYAGLRVAADATSLVRSPAQLEAFASWEHLVDRFMTENAFSALCGFDRQRLPGRSTVALACLHPAARQGVTAFRVFASEDGAGLALAGDLDATVAEEFRASLERIRLHVRRELVVDATMLDFVDHRALQSIRDFAGRFGATAVIRTDSNLPGRLLKLLGLQGIRAEPVTAGGVHP